MKCFECGSSQRLHDHHVIPKSLGGDRTVKLCEKCHGTVHGKNFMHHKSLQRLGIERAKANGTVFGRPKRISNEQYPTLVFEVFSGMTTKEIQQKYKCSAPTARRIRKKALTEISKYD